jgi:hypothetical protein
LAAAIQQAARRFVNGIALDIAAARSCITAGWTTSPSGHYMRDLGTDLLIRGA